MDYSKLDLTRFSKITAEEYYTTDWNIVGLYKQYAKYLDSLDHYQRHLRGTNEWNLWACAYRDRYLEDHETDTVKDELYETGKTLKSELHHENNHLIIDFTENTPAKLNNKYQIDYFHCVNFIFPFSTRFHHLTIPADSSFHGSTFLDIAYFNDCHFKSNVEFGAAEFYGIALFFNTKVDQGFHIYDALFEKEVNFMNMSFSVRTKLNHTLFGSDVRFNATLFNHGIQLIGNSFYKNVDFSNAKFLKSSQITECVFGNKFIFMDVNVSRAIELSQNHFLNASDFSGTEFNGACILNNTTFGTIEKFNKKIDSTIPTRRLFLSLEVSNKLDVIPDFTDTKFSIAPNLSFTYIQSAKKLKWWKTFYKTPENSIHKLAASKYRRLKELAHLSQNHIEEAELFRQEMLARRSHEATGIDEFLINLYEYFSKCGLSIKRPFIGLMAITAFFALIYFLLYPADVVELREIPKIAFLKYSFHQALPVVGASVPEKTAVIETLFGSYRDRPTIYGVVSVFQTLISLGFEFLILLGVRNYFKMR